MKTAKYLSLLALSALLVGCGPTSDPTSAPTSTPDAPTSEPTSEPTSAAPVFVAPEAISLYGSSATDVDFSSSDEGHTWVLESYALYEGDSWKVRMNHDWGTEGTGHWGASYLDDASKAIFGTAEDGGIAVTKSGYYTISFDYDNSVISATLDEAILPTFAEAVAKSVTVTVILRAVSVNIFVYLNDNDSIPPVNVGEVRDPGADVLPFKQGAL